MEIHALDKAHLVNELNVGQSLSHAVQDGRRADFAFLVSFFSDDMRESAPTELVPNSDINDQQLRTQLGVPQPQALNSDFQSYDVAKMHNDLFHKSGMTSVRFAQQLIQDSLTYRPQDTHNLPEDLYHNLSGHTRRQLQDKDLEPIHYNHLLQQLVSSRRLDQIELQTGQKIQALA